MRTLAKGAIFALFISLFVGTFGTALAYSPVMTVSSSGNSTTVSITGGQPNTSVVISYTPYGSSLSTSVTGVTDFSGSFTTMVDSQNSSQITATVGGQQVYTNGNGYNNNGCGYYGASCGGLSLSQTSLSLSIGQSASVTANLPYPVSGYSSNIYIGSNSNSAVASASVSGNMVTIYGSSSGVTNISVCANSSGGACATLNVTVGNGSSYGSITFSPSTVNLSTGQNTTVYITAVYYGTSLYISNNSNPSAVSASLSGSTLYLYAGNIGSSTITVCQSNSVCGSLSVSVGSSGYSGNIYFSPSSLSLSSGQTSTVVINNGSYTYGSYFISSNSNSGAASASISGSSLYVNALSAGSTNIIVCQSGSVSSCATLFVTVTGVLGANTNLWFSPANPNLYVGQSLAVSINSSAYSTSYPYYSSAYYISSNSSSGVVSASVSGTVLNLYAYQNGSGNITVCHSSLGFCGTLYVTVGGGASYGGTLSLSQTSLSLNQGQSKAITASNVPSVYVLSNNNSGVVAVSVSGNQATFYGQGTGSGTVMLCGVSSSQCASVYVTVNNGYGSNIILSQYSLGMNIGQTATVNVSGAGGYGYYISSNSNPGAISASFNGSVITIYAISNGSSTLQICQNSASSCVSLAVTVGSGYSYGGGVTYPRGNVLGANTYPNGQLISEGSTVYTVYKNTKTPFSSASVFLGLGFKFGNVVAVGDSGLTDSGYTVANRYTQHPWGTWIKSGNTVYFVSDTGLIPLPDWATFLNNGGQSNLIVPANIYDFRLPILSPMVTGDPRLQ